MHTLAFRNSGIADGFLAIAATPVTATALAAPGATTTSSLATAASTRGTRTTTAPGPLDLPLARKGICADVAERCLHRIWLGSTTGLVVSRTTIITPLPPLTCSVVPRISGES